MGTPRVLTRYDVHCMDCGASEEVREEPTRCPIRRCRSENITYENNEKYCLTRLFTKQGEDGDQYYRPDVESGYMEHPLHLSGEW